FPNAYVIVHIGGAYNVADYDCWFFTDFKNAGGKFDMIGLSHYPDTNDWASTTSGTISNYNAAAGIQALGEKFNVPVMICETGFSSSNPTTASAVMTDLFDRMTDVSCCAGIFYWEPEVYGGWKPSYYTSLGWGAYGMGAFSNGKPTAALDAFKGSDVTSPDWYLTGDFDLWGMSVAFTQSTTNPDVFTIDNYTVNAADLDQYGFFKFHVVSANWTENYVYNANISTLGTYTLMTAGSDGAWDNVYCTAMTTGKTYRLTWNRNTHEFTITSRQLGDVDNDGIVNVSDLTALINYILGTTPADFVIENANVNGEGVIDVSDITALINLILQ
ncbi:MAG: glycosyl hydrolase 53 family protein, partial [Muribaculaceae bacterium]|nr:glycosyl hydrolase 53 family protein [Muribaculaceae bacterium]